MNSLFAKILLWFWATLAITVVGSALISALTMDENVSNREAPASRLVALQLEEARATWESGGAPALGAFLSPLSRIYGAEGILTDARGRDLATGRDRSDLLRPARLRLAQGRRRRNSLARADSGRYHRARARRVADSAWLPQ